MQFAKIRKTSVIHKQLAIFSFFCISTALFHLTHKVGGTYVIAMPKSQKVLAWYLLLDEQTLNKTT